MANHPIERMIQVQTAACAAVRMLILAALRNLNLTLISSPNRGKRKRFHVVFLFVIVADQHHWAGGSFASVCSRQVIQLGLMSSPDAERNSSIFC